MTTLDDKLNIIADKHATLDARLSALEARYGSEGDKTQLEYQSLFTVPELVAIEIAAQTDPTLRVLQRMQQAASFISLSDPRTIQGMQYLLSKNLITQERYNEILGITTVN